MRGAKELCLEDYVRFFNKEEFAHTMNHLSKIARINGFIRAAKFKKSSLLDALRTVELTPPGRSTIGECPLRSSSNAELSLEEVMKDIASIGWQECPIVSILTVCNECATETTKENALISSSCSSDQAKLKGNNGGASKGSGTKRKGNSVAALVLA